MFCPKCGKILNETANFCSGCGFSKENINLLSVKDTDNNCSDTSSHDDISYNTCPEQYDSTCSTTSEPENSNKETNNLYNNQQFSNQSSSYYSDNIYDNNHITTMSTKDFVVMLLLMAIPLFNIGYVVYLAIQDKNIIKRSLARAIIIVSLIFIGFALLFSLGAIFSCYPYFIF